VRILVAILALLVLGGALSGCQKKVSVERAAADVRGEASKPGAMLAYEHSVGVDLDATQLPARIAALRDACTEARFGACSLLRVEESAGVNAHGVVIVRVVPAAVEPLVKIAAEHATLGSREMHAEDLAEAVADVARKRDLLERERTRLLEAQSRKDLAVADVLTIAHELASIESQLDELGRSAAQQQRRIDTNLLTIRFDATRETSRWSRVGAAFGRLADESVSGIESVIEAIGFLLPIAPLVFGFALAWRWLWRRATRAT
jgi:hypothetical protein